MKELFYAIPDWVWWLIATLFIIKWLSNIVGSRSDVINGQLERINSNLVEIGDKLDKLDKLDELDHIEMHLRKLDFLDSLDKLNNLDELDWWTTDKRTFATQVIDILETISKIKGAKVGTIKGEETFRN